MINQTKVDELTESLKQYVGTSAELFKLEAIEQGSLIAAKIISSTITGLILLLFLVFGSFGLGYFLSDIVDSKFLGFLIVAGGYLVIGLILLLFKKRLIETPFINRVIKTIFYKK